MKHMSSAPRDEGIPLPKVAALDERTVQKVARGEVEIERIRPKSGRVVRCITTRNEKVLPAIMAAALALAGGDVSRISITDEHEVVVLNNKRGT